MAGRDLNLWILLALVGAVAVAGAVLLVTADDAPLPTEGPSMGRTLPGNDPVDVDTHAYDRRAPAVGEIVVAQAPRGVRADRCGARHGRRSPCATPPAGYATLRVLKRVVAGPGDRIAFAADGTAIRNGRRVREPYITRCRPRFCALPRAATVPAGHVFLAGDNRGNSSDSRIWGPVPVAALDGQVNLDRKDPR